MLNQYRVTTNKGDAYLAYAGGGVLAGDAIQLAMNCFYCPLRSIARVEIETETVTTVLYDEYGQGYTVEDLTRLFYACRRN